ncbi:MAG: S9 family peptidase [Deltaproteobacteria bacterium]|nr:S9 family peptidase [Deltaproteobacteria bacterium]
MMAGTLKLACLPALLLALPAPAAEKMSIDDAIDLGQVSDPRISPDGDWIAYVVQRAGSGSEPVEGDIHLVPADGGPARRYTTRAGLEHHPRWSPDSRWLYFLARHDKRVQVHRIALRGGESQPVTAEARDVEDFCLSPDGRWLAFTVMQAEQECPACAEHPVARVRDEICHRVLRIQPADGGSSSTVSPAGRSVFDFAWSPDGLRLAAFAASEPGPGEGYWKADLLLIDRESTQASTLAAGLGSSKLAFSPDGARLALLAAPAGHHHRCLAIVELADGSRRSLAPEHPVTIWDFAWLPGGERLALWGHEGVEGFVGCTPLRGGEVQVWQRMPLRAWGDPALSLSADGRWMAFLAEDPTHPPEVFAASPPAGRRRAFHPRRLTFTNAEIEKRALGRVEAIEWQASDGERIQGLVVHPAGAESEGAAPTVLMIHGGPQWQYWRGWLGGWHEPAQVLAARGYRVLLPNPRGSTGRGQRFAEAALADWGGADRADIEAGLDHLVARGLADPKRLAIVGWSYGGYMTAWMITSSRRFRAAVVGAGVSDLLSMHACSDIPHFLPEQFGRLPFQMPDLLRERSPVFFAHRVSTPVLIVHGEADRRVPYGQAIELHRALADAGARVRLVGFPDEPHHFQRRESQKRLLEEIVAWLDRHLAGDAGSR